MSGSVRFADPEIQKAVETLINKGITPEEYAFVYGKYGQVRRLSASGAEITARGAVEDGQD